MVLKEQEERLKRYSKMAESLNIDKNGKTSFTDIPEDASIMKAYSLAMA